MNRFTSKRLDNKVIAYGNIWNPRSLKGTKARKRLEALEIVMAELTNLHNLTIDELRELRLACYAGVNSYQSCGGYVKKWKHCLETIRKEIVSRTGKC